MKIYLKYGNSEGHNSLVLSGPGRLNPNWSSGSVRCTNFEHSVGLLGVIGDDPGDDPGDDLGDDPNDDKDNPLSDIDKRLSTSDWSTSLPVSDWSEVLSPTGNSLFCEVVA